MIKFVLFAVALFACWTHSVHGFVWDLNEKLFFEEPVVVSEGYSFGTNDGPFLMSSGKSFIDVDVRFEAMSHSNDSIRVLMVHVASDEEHGRSVDIMPSLCELTHNSHALEKLPFVYESTVRVLPLHFDSCQSQDEIATLSCYRSLSITERFDLHHTAWHSLLFVNCEGPDGRSSSGASNNNNLVSQFTVRGTISFKNPYGYISAELSGLLPSHLLRVLLCVAITSVFIYSCSLFRDSLLPLHYAVSVLLILALSEAVSWTVAFFWTLNGQGYPYCCPFPTTVGIALIIQVLRQALSRAVLQVVCLGYGIVRPKLLLLEWVVLTLLTVSYLAAALAAQSYSLARFTSLSKASEGAPWPIQAAAAFLDLVFLLWIAASAQHTMRVLAEYRQTAKLALYTSLWRLLSVAVCVFVVISLVFFLDDVHVIDGGEMVHWRLTWLQPALWDLLNVGVLIAVAVLCLPSERAKLLAYHAQLPQQDMDFDLDDAEDGGGDLRDAFRNRGRQSYPSNSLLDDDDDEEDGDAYFRTNNGLGQSNGSDWTMVDSSSHGPKRSSGSGKQTVSSKREDSKQQSHRLDDDAEDGYDMEMVLLKQRGGFVRNMLNSNSAFSARLSDDEDDDDLRAYHRAPIGGGISARGSNQNQKRTKNVSSTTNKSVLAEDEEFGLKDSD